MRDRLSRSISPSRSVCLLLLIGGNHSCCRSNSLADIEYTGDCPASIRYRSDGRQPHHYRTVHKTSQIVNPPYRRKELCLGFPCQLHLDRNHRLTIDYSYFSLRVTPVVGLDHGADRVGNISSTVDTVISRHIGVDSIVHFNYKGRTSPGVVDSDLTVVADYRSHWHSSLFSEEQLDLPEQCGQSVPCRTESKMR